MVPHQRNQSFDSGLQNGDRPIIYTTVIRAFDSGLQNGDGFAPKESEL